MISIFKKRKQVVIPQPPIEEKTYEELDPGSVYHYSRLIDIYKEKLSIINKDYKQAGVLWYMLFRCDLASLQYLYWRDLNQYVQHYRYKSALAILDELENRKYDAQAGQVAEDV
jgi:hypothetical protein